MDKPYGKIPTVLLLMVTPPFLEKKLVNLLIGSTSSYILSKRIFSLLNYG